MALTVLPVSLATIYFHSLAISLARNKLMQVLRLIVHYVLLLATNVRVALVPAFHVLMVHSYLQETATLPVHQASIKKIAAALYVNRNVLYAIILNQMNVLLAHLQLTTIILSLTTALLLV